MIRDDWEIAGDQGRRPLRKGGAGGRGRHGASRPGGIWAIAVGAGAGCLAVIASLVGAVPAADGMINAAQYVPPSAVDVTSEGVLWSDEDGFLRLVSPDGQVRVLGGGAPDPIVGRGALVAALATGGRSGVEVAVARVPHAMHGLAVGPSVGPGGCRDWSAAPAPLENLGGQIAFAVSGNELVLAGTPACRHAMPAAPRPLFARSLPDGRWHVLRWLPNAITPVLAAGGKWLAVGTLAAHNTTSVDVINAQTGRLRNHVALPGTFAELTLDASGLLVAAVDTAPPVPLPAPPGSPPGSPPVMQAGAASVAAVPTTPQTSTRTYWVAPGSRRVQRLPSVDSTVGPWALSDGRLAYVVANHDATSTNPDGTTTLTVTDLRRHTTRRISGFDQERDLLALDLGGSRLAWVQSDQTLLPTSMWSCTTGPFATGPRTLHVIDLDTAGAFTPAPPAPVLPSVALSCPQDNEQ
jgi:hypothetical protein